MGSSCEDKLEAARSFALANGIVQGEGCVDVGCVAERLVHALDSSVCAKLRASRTEFVSVAEDCHVALMLRAAGAHTTTWPFDWNRKSLSRVVHALQHRVDGLLLDGSRVRLGNRTTHVVLGAEGSTSGDGQRGDSRGESEIGSNEVTYPCFDEASGFFLVSYSKAPPGPSPNLNVFDKSTPPTNKNKQGHDFEEVGEAAMEKVRAKYTRRFRRLYSLRR